MNEQSSLEQNIADVKNELKIFSNLNIIVDKIETDGLLYSIVDFIEKLFKNELHFALSGELSRNAEIGYRDEA